VPTAILSALCTATIGALAACVYGTDRSRASSSTCRSFEAGVRWRFGRRGLFRDRRDSRAARFPHHQTQRPTRRSAPPTASSPSAPRLHATGVVLRSSTPGVGERRAFQGQPSRHARRDVLIPMIEQVTARKPRAYWVSRFQEGGVPCAEIRTYDQVFNDPQLQAARLLLEKDGIRAGRRRADRLPDHFSDTPVRRGRGRPGAGEPLRRCSGR